jgi:hypothetical protein
MILLLLVIIEKLFDICPTQSSKKVLQQKVKTIFCCDESYANYQNRLDQAS